MTTKESKTAVTELRAGEDDMSKISFEEAQAWLGQERDSAQKIVDYHYHHGLDPNSISDSLRYLDAKRKVQIVNMISVILSERKR